MNTNKIENKVEKLLIDTGAMMTGHFVLTSGLHSNKYIEKFRVLEDPLSLDTICKEMAFNFSDEKIDIVVGAAVGGILLSLGVARELACKGIFSERSKGEMLFKRGFSIPDNSNILIVEDIVTTGGSIKEIIHLLSKFKVHIKGITSLAHRGDTIDFGYPYKPLTEIQIQTWEENEIPNWLEKISITKPGSTGK